MFKFLLNFSIDNNYFEKMDFSNNPREYCGMTLDNNYY